MRAHISLRQAKETSSTAVNFPYSLVMEEAVITSCSPLALRPPPVIAYAVRYSGSMVFIDFPYRGQFVPPQAAVWGVAIDAKRCASQFNSGSERCISGRSSLGNMGRRLSSARRHWAAW